MYHPNPFIVSQGSTTQRTENTASDERGRLMRPLQPLAAARVPVGLAQLVSLPLRRYNRNFKTSLGDAIRRERIVSLAPSVTSILVALGAQDELVGVTKWCADVARLPARLRARQARLGDCWSLDIEQVARLRPTLVIGSVPYKQETVAKLLKCTFPFLATNPRSLEDIYADIRLLGRIVGRAEAARRVVTQMRAAFNAIAARARRAKSRPRVYAEAWPNPRITSPPWVEELVEIVGGSIVLPCGQRVTDQAIARAMPDVIVIGWTATGARPPAKKTLANPAWQDVPAVRNRRVFIVRDDLLNTPGPPLIKGAQELFRILHPELATLRSEARRGN